jgi:hypothetical protein
MGWRLVRFPTMRQLIVRGVQPQGGAVSSNVLVVVGSLVGGERQVLLRRLSGIPVDSRSQSNGACTREKGSRTENTPAKLCGSEK